jgi:hypothetical protein
MDIPSPEVGRFGSGGDGFRWNEEINVESQIAQQWNVNVLSLLGWPG